MEKRKLKVCTIATMGSDFTDGFWSHLRGEGRYPLAWAKCLAQEGHDITVAAPGAKWGCYPPIDNVRLQDYLTKGEKYDVYLGTSYLPEELVECDATIELHWIWKSLLDRIEKKFPQHKNYKLKSNQRLTYVYESCREGLSDNGHWGDNLVFLPWPVASEFSGNGYDNQEITWAYRNPPAKGDIKATKEIEDVMRATVDVANDLDLTCNFLMSHQFVGEKVSGTRIEEIMMSAKKKNLYSGLLFNKYMDIISRSKIIVGGALGASANIDPIFKGVLSVTWGEPIIFNNIGKKYGWIQPVDYSSTKKNLYYVLENRERYNEILSCCQNEIKESLYGNALKHFYKIIEESI